MRFAPLALVVVVGSVPIAEQDPSQRAAFTAGTHVVMLNVSVQHKGIGVPGLAAKDFEVRDNGVVQAVDLQAADVFPVDVSIIFGQSQARVIPFRLAADLPQIARRLLPTDRLRVIGYATDVREVFPMGAPSRWQGGDLGREALAEARATLGIDQSVDSRHDPKRMGESLFDAIVWALMKPQEAGRRHLVVAFCYQLERLSVLDDGPLLAELAERADATLHIAFSSWRGPEGPYDSVQGQYTRLALTEAARATGGDLQAATNGVGAFKKIFDDFRSSYLLTYTLTGVPAEGWHAIDVRVPGHPAYDVRARKGYMGR